jgi:hypothetical protein
MVAMTRYPFFANSSAVSRPKPLLVPVMSAIFTDTIPLFRPFFKNAAVSLFQFCRSAPWCGLPPFPLPPHSAGFPHGTPQK